MKFYRCLYIGESAKKHWKKIVWKLKHHAGQLGIYVITLAPGNDLMEIFHCSVLKQKYYKKNPPFIIGIAGGYDEAVGLVQRIVQEVYRSTGGFDVKSYISLRQNGGSDGQTDFSTKCAGAPDSSD